MALRWARRVLFQVLSEEAATVEPTDEDSAARRIDQLENQLEIDVACTQIIGGPGSGPWSGSSWSWGAREHTAKQLEACEELGRAVVQRMFTDSRMLTIIMPEINKTASFENLISF